MERSNRTAQCKRCGSTELKIVPSAGKVKYVCKTCDGQVGTVKLEKYETLYPVCKSCNGEVFKVRIEEDKLESHWNARCSHCNATPDTYYVNDGGEVIDQHTRQVLIIQDSISGILSELGNLKRGLNNLNSSNDDLSENDTITDNYIDGLEAEDEQAASYLTGISEVILNIEKAVADIEHRVKQL